MKKILIAVLALSLAACGSFGGNKPDADYAAYLTAHQAAQSAYKPEIQLVKIKAMPGQNITMSGVAEFTVSMPATPQAGVQQAQAKSSELVEALKVVMPVAGAVGGIFAAGSAAKGLATAVGNVAKTPQANVTDYHGVDSHAVDTHAVDSHAVDSHAATQPAALTQ